MREESQIDAFCLARSLQYGLLHPLSRHWPANFQLNKNLLVQLRPSPDLRSRGTPAVQPLSDHRLQSLRHCVGNLRIRHKWKLALGKCLQVPPHRHSLLLVRFSLLSHSVRHLAVHLAQAGWEQEGSLGQVQFLGSVPADPPFHRRINQLLLLQPTPYQASERQLFRRGRKTPFQLDTLREVPLLDLHLCVVHARRIPRHTRLIQLGCLHRPDPHQVTLHHYEDAVVFGLREVPARLHTADPSSEEWPAVRDWSRQVQQGGAKICD